MFGNNFLGDPLMPYPRPSSGAASRRTRRFDEYFRCYPIAALDRPELNYGGKIIMPPSALEKLTRLHIAYPMLFELHNGTRSRTTHAGVLEFIAEEGRVYLPYWMMQTLSLEHGDLLQIKSTDLPSGSFIKLQPQSTAFLTAISDPKAVLENVLRNFSALTKDDTFEFLYNDEVFAITILETKPAEAVSCVETDLEVDFAPPLDYVEPIPTATSSAGSSRPGSVVGGGRVTPVTQTEGSMAKTIGYSSLASSTLTKSAFAGTGQKLKGSRTGTPGTSTPVNPQPTPPPTVARRNGPQPLRLPPGKLFFGYEYKPVKKNGKGADADADAAKKSIFSGAGQTLRKAGKGKNKAEPIELD